MKTKLILSIAIYAAIASFGVLGSGQTLNAGYASYVVIGAFAVRDHANVWVENAKKMNFNAVSAINPVRNLYYVYVLHTLDREVAVIEANRVRKGSPYSDTWVYTGALGSQAVAVQGSDANPVTGQLISKVEIQDAAVPVRSEESAAAPIDSLRGETPSGVVPSKKAPVADAEAGSKNFLFKIFTANDQRELAGDVDVMDVDRGKKVASYQGNQNVVIRPVNKTGNISLVCEVFGYRKLQQDLNFDRPQETEGIVTEGNQTIVPFGLIRLRKGDVSVMYNVYFFKDAAIMQPQSRTEVASLLTMMKENPNLRIKIHGHTNGNSPGKVISMGKSKKFFSLTDTREGFGSAKKLSEERAKVIREYLQAEGIDEKRMEIKAWGGKRPVKDKLGAQARSNVRVEIEILEDK
jgi:outer membrane protein OmpA-like peptidoglycan-associated protein